MRIGFCTETRATSSVYRRLKRRFSRLTQPAWGSLIGLIQTTSPSSNSTRVSSSQPSASASVLNSSTVSGGRDSSCRSSTAMIVPPSRLIIADQSCGWKRPSEHRVDHGRCRMRPRRKGSERAEPEAAQELRGRDEKPGSTATAEARIFGDQLAGYERLDDGVAVDAADGAESA